MIPGGNIKFQLQERKNNHFSLYSNPQYNIVYGSPAPLNLLKYTLSGDKLKLEWLNPKQTLLTERTYIDISTTLFSQHYSFQRISGNLTSIIYDISYGKYYNFILTAAGPGGRSSQVTFSNSIVSELQEPTVTFDISDQTIIFDISNIDNTSFYIEYSEYSDFRKSTTIENQTVVGNLYNGLKYWFKIYYKCGEYRSPDRFIGPLIPVKYIKAPTNIKIFKYFKNGLELRFNAGVYEDNLLNLKSIMVYKVRVSKYQKLDSDIYYKLDTSEYIIEGEEVDAISEYQSTNKSNIIKININNLDEQYHYNIEVASLINYKEKNDIMSEYVVAFEHLYLKKYPAIDFKVEADPYIKEGIRVWWNENQAIHLYIRKIDTDGNPGPLIIKTVNKELSDKYTIIRDDDLFEIGKEYLIAAVLIPDEIDISGRIIETEITNFTSVLLKECAMPPTSGIHGYNIENPESLYISWSGSNSTEHVIVLKPEEGETLKYHVDNDNNIYAEGLLLGIRYSIEIFAKNENGLSATSLKMNDIIMGIPLPPTDISHTSIIRNNMLDITITITGNQFDNLLNLYNYDIKGYNIYLYNSSMRMISMTKIPSKLYTFQLPSIFKGTVYVFVEPFNDAGGFYSKGIYSLDSPYIYKKTINIV